MPGPVLHYVHDPLCGWCYAAAPMVDAIREVGIPLSLHGGGLWASPTELSPDKSAYIRESDAGIASLSGQRFAEVYTDGLLDDPAAVFWSLPTVAAVQAAERVEPRVDLQMLHAIQVAHYLDGRRVVDPRVLADVAVGIRLDARSFERSFDLDAAADHIASTRAFMRRLGLRGFPSFVLEAGSEPIGVPHEGYYGRPAAFVAAVAAATEQRAAPDAEPAPRSPFSSSLPTGVPPMKIALIGATGFVGAKILAESLDRDHDVTAVVRDAAALPTVSNLRGVEADATDADALAAAVADHDLVISAFNPGSDPNGTGTQAIIDGVKWSGVDRLLAVGGAGTLEIAPGQRLIDQPDFPAEWKAGALRTAVFLDQLHAEQDLDWTFVSPAANLAPGERTGRYRVGGDQLMTDEVGESRISLEDYAVAMLDEAERPAHHRTRFSVAY